MDAVLVLMNAVFLAFVVATMFAAGAVLGSGSQKSRPTAGIVAANRNAGPVLLVAAASFADVEGVIPAIISVYIVQLVSQVVLASWLGKREPDAMTEPV